MTRHTLTRLRNRARYYTPLGLLIGLAGAVAYAAYAVVVVIGKNL